MNTTGTGYDNGQLAIEAINGDDGPYGYYQITNTTSGNWEVYMGGPWAPPSPTNFTSGVTIGGATSANSVLFYNLPTGDYQIEIYGQSGCDYYPGTFTIGDTPPVPGCMDATACNYDPLADVDDSTCDFESCSGCTDVTASNFGVSNF